MAVPQARILDLMKAQCRIFSTVYNPERLRIGTKILRQRLKGPSIASYYPDRPVGWRNLHRAYRQLGTTLDNEDENDRLQKLDELRARGKGQWQERRGVTTTGKRRR